jgi:hypothetical protein
VIEKGAPRKKLPLVQRLAGVAMAGAVALGFSENEYVYRWRDALSHSDLPPYLIGAAETLTRMAAPDRPFIWASNEHLAEIWGITERAAIERVHALEAYGAVEKIRRDGEDEHEPGEARSKILIFKCLKGFHTVAVNRGVLRAPTPSSESSARPAPERPLPAPAKPRKRRSFTKEELDTFLSTIMAEPELEKLAHRAQAAKLLGVRPEGQTCADAAQAMCQLADKTDPNERATFGQAFGFLRGFRKEERRGPEYLEDKPEPVVEAAPFAEGVRGLLNALSGAGPPQRPR